MNATERLALLEGVQLYDEMTATVDDRTLEILDRRRRTAIVKRRGWLMRRMLLLADVLGLVAAFLFAEWLISPTASLNGIDARAEFFVFALSLPGWIVVTKVYGLYDHDEERTDHSTADDVVGVFHMLTVGVWLFYALAYVTKVAHPELPKLLLFWVTAIVLVSVGRATARAYCRRQINYLQNTIIVGAGEVGQVIARKLLNHPEYGINLVGFVDRQPKDRREDLDHLTLMGTPERLPALVRLFDIERVIIAFSGDPHEQTLDLIRSMKDLDVQIDIVPRLFELVGPNVGFHMIEGLPLIGLPPLHLSRSSRLLKRVLDIVLSAIGLVLAAPILVAAAAAVKVDSRGPIFYRHRRLGLGGKPIDVIKFRTMRLDACRGERYGGEGAEHQFAALLADSVRAAEFTASYKFEGDPRVTRIGGILRKFSIDELPQLLNVLKGDLSLVGPRPITQDEIGRYAEFADSLLNIRPGVTGYWQINGRSSLSYEDRVRLDLSYIRSWSLGLDLTILGKTLRVLVSRNGAL
jgi:exopolysaccharide biosynthesis polyprenyl glycosylphosphotransferase